MRGPRVAQGEPELAMAGGPLAAEKVRTSLPPGTCRGPPVGVAAVVRLVLEVLAEPVCVRLSAVVVEALELAGAWGAPLVLVVVPQPASALRSAATVTATTRRNRRESVILVYAWDDLRPVRSHPPPRVLAMHGTIRS